MVPGEPRRLEIDYRQGLMNLKTAFQTAKYAKYAKGEGVEQESVFINW